MWLLDEAALEDLTIGSTILGAGGGGDPYIGKLLARESIRQYGPVTIVDADELEDDARVVMVAGMGAPTVIVEKLLETSELVDAFYALQDRLGVEFTHISSAEAGGLNAVTPIPVAAKLRLPMIDADGMGRAFPKLELITPTLYGGSVTPMSLVDERGARVIIETPTNAWAETIARAATVSMGCMGAVAICPMTGKQAKEWLVWGVLTQAEELGRTLREARAEKVPPVQAILDHANGVLLFEGKTSEVNRRTERGWNIGEAVFAGSGDYKRSELKLQFQNEHLVAIRDGKIVASVPDLIMILEADNGEPITAEEIRYGYRVAVVGLPCDSRWRSPEGLALAGPRAFGYDEDYVPIGGGDVVSAHAPA
jgi:hypothetical protein